MKIVTKKVVPEQSHFISDFDGKSKAYSQLVIYSGYGSEMYDGVKYEFDLSDKDVEKVLNYLKKNLKDKDLKKYIKEDIFGAQS